MQLKDEGNKLFVKGQFRKSLAKYNEALNLADCDNFGLILGNRSAAYFNLKEYKHALEDINTAFEANYPKHLELKLLERRLLVKNMVYNQK